MFKNIFFGKKISQIITNMVRYGAKCYYIKKSPTHLNAGTYSKLSLS